MVADVALLDWLDHLSGESQPLNPNSLLKRHPLSSHIICSLAAVICLSSINASIILPHSMLISSFTYLSSISWILSPSSVLFSFLVLKGVFQLHKFL
eukprot:TRINITY_DN101424_c0_g1_i1.p1 TRINITY_DN101424_c0_g1~~TRINITY_DN101424_c0_g1_i1.p1  ORF type:complete len:110 (+),score=6.60 TRINITY_DN101424_c0_g1_i1:41-331(+)